MDFEYPTLGKTLRTFHVKVEGGHFQSSEIVVLLGENGTGKSTFVHMLAGRLKADNVEMEKMAVSLKPQKITPKFEGTVRNLLDIQLGYTWTSTLFEKEVIKPLKIKELLEDDFQTLSGG